MGFLNWIRKLPAVFWPLVTKRLVVTLLVLLPALYVSYRIGKHSTLLNLSWGDIVYCSGADKENAHWIRRLYAIIWYTGNWFTSLPYLHHKMEYFEQFHGLDWAMRRFTFIGGFILTWPTHANWRYVVPVAAFEYLNLLNWPDELKINDFIPIIFDVWHTMGRYLDEARAMHHMSLFAFFGGDVLVMGSFLFVMLGFLPILAYHRFWCILFADKYEHMLVFKPLSITWIILAIGVLWAVYRVYFANKWEEYSLRRFFPSIIFKVIEPRPEELVQQRVGVVFFWLMFPAYVAIYYLFWRCDISGFTYYMYDFGSTYSFWDQWEFKYLTGWEHVNYIRFLPFISIYFSLGFFAYYSDDKYIGWHMEVAAKLATIMGFMLLSIWNMAIFLFFFQCFMYVALNVLIDSVKPENCNQPEIEINLEVSRRVLLRSWGASVILTILYLLYFYAFTKTLNFDAAWIKYNLKGLYVQKMGCMLLGAFTGAPYMMRWKNNANIYMSVTQPIPILRLHRGDMRRQYKLHMPTMFLYYGVISIAGFWLTAYCFWQWTWATGQYKLILFIFVVKFILFYVMPKQIRFVRHNLPEYEFMDHQVRWFLVHTLLIWKYGFEQFIFAIFIITNWYQIFGIARMWDWTGMSTGCYRFFQPVGAFGNRHFNKIPFPGPWDAQWRTIDWSLIVDYREQVKENARIQAKRKAIKTYIRTFIPNLWKRIRRD